jgi:type 1 glutamine amidotransferase
VLRESHPTPALLLYTRTDVPHHPSIAAGVRAIGTLAATAGFRFTHSEDPSVFAAADPVRAAVVVFLNTAVDELDAGHRESLTNYIRGGAGFVGIHSASYFERDWPWYETLVGARFAGHPEPQTARVEIVDRGHPATRNLPAEGHRLDEWYNYRTLPSGVRVLATVDESTYAGGVPGARRPVMWCRSVEGSRSFYTALGHTEECFSDDLYLGHILGAARWAARLED